MNKLNAIPGSFGLAATLLAAGSACATDIADAGATFIPWQTKRTNTATAREALNFYAWAY